MRLIDADPFELISYEGIPDGFSDSFDDGVAWLAEQIDAAPTMPSDSRPAGEWVVRFDGPYGRRRTYCTNCGKHSGIGGIKQMPPFCPNCGAMMGVKKDD